jgi:hypothetical protein
MKRIGWRGFLVLVGLMLIGGTALLAQAGAPAAPADLVALWAGGLAVVTATVTQVLKKVSAPIANAPDWAKAGLGFVVALVSTKLSAFFGAPIPPDLGGFAAVVVNWAASMGLHTLAKKTGVVTDASQA